MSYCRICGNSGNNIYYNIKEMMFGINETFKYFECSKCKTLQIESIPKNMSKYYPDNYFSMDLSRLNETQSKFILTIKKKFCKIYLSKYLGFLLNPIVFKKNLVYLEILKKAGANQSSKILDVGSGSGTKLLSLWNFGFKGLIGSDPYLFNTIHYRSGLKIISNGIFQLNEKYNVIMFNHSLEHMENPLEVLIKANHLLFKDGICIVRIPVTESYSWYHYRENWISLDAPRHFYLLNLKAMKLLAKKAGFHIKEYEYESSEYQFFGSEQNIAGIPLMSDNSYYINPSKSIFNKNQIRQFKKHAKILNKNKTGDIMCFWLYKNGF